MPQKCCRRYHHQCCNPVLSRSVVWCYCTPPCSSSVWKGICPPPSLHHGLGEQKGWSQDWEMPPMRLEKIIILIIIIMMKNPYCKLFITVHFWLPDGSEVACTTRGFWVGRAIKGRWTLDSSDSCNPSACHRYLRARWMLGTPLWRRCELFFCQMSYLEYLVWGGFWKVSLFSAGKTTREVDERSRSDLTDFAQ